MIQNYVDKLIENLPHEIKNNKSTINIDLVLDGGAFNGSYLAGALCFLREMENRKYIKIKRISGCSIGSLVGLIYFMDNFELFDNLYKQVYADLKENRNLQILKNLKNLMKDYMPDDLYKKINKRLYISYKNINKREKVIKKTYTSNDDIINTIIKSCFIPFMIDGNLLYKNTYIDGINPYIFKAVPNRKILYLDLYGYDKITNLLSLKNEQTNFHRILTGLLDIHNFYIKQSNTPMCSYVNDWSLTNKLHNLIKVTFERICIYIVCILVYLQKIIPVTFLSEFEDNVFYQLFIKILKEFYILMIDRYFFN